MRIVFMGSAELACYSLKALLRDSDNEIVCVITQPDRPQGRNLNIRSCPVKIMAVENKLKTFTPLNINLEESLLELRQLSPDLIVVVAYGQILKTAVLDLPALGCVNLHTSLLPKYRGAAPIQWAIVNGDSVTGVTTMYMDKGMDTGDIIAQKSLPIGSDATAAEIHDNLAEIGAEELTKTVTAIRNGIISRIPQNDAEATYAPKITKQDGKIDWTQTAVDVHNRVRGFNPWPCCFCIVASGVKTDARLRVLSSSVVDSEGEPGKILDVDAAGPVIACAKGAVRLDKVQPAGKKPMSGSDYIRGHNLSIDSVLM